MLISGHAQAGDIQAASGMLEAMALRGLVPNRESYNTIISCLCRAGEARQAQTVVAMAARRGITLDEWAWSAVVQARAAPVSPPFPSSSALDSTIAIVFRFCVASAPVMMLRWCCNDASLRFLGLCVGTQ